VAASPHATMLVAKAFGLTHRLVRDADVQGHSLVLLLATATLVIVARLAAGDGLCARCWLQKKKKKVG